VEIAGRRSGGTRGRDTRPSLGSCRAETEQFGFHDGIANPRIKGLKDSEAAIEPGEFLLGYSERRIKSTPRVPESGRANDPSRILPLDEEETGAGDFGRNGSYLVRSASWKQDAFRVLERARRALRWKRCGA
jgi:deferrochelatase/peroxidase EfeB